MQSFQEKKAAAYEYSVNCVEYAGLIGRNMKIDIRVDREGFFVVDVKCDNDFLSRSFTWEELRDCPDNLLILSMQKMAHDEFGLGDKDFSKIQQCRDELDKSLLDRVGL